MSNRFRYTEMIDGGYISTIIGLERRSDTEGCIQEKTYFDTAAFDGKCRYLKEERSYSKKDACEMHKHFEKSYLTINLSYLSDCYESLNKLLLKDMETLNGIISIAKAMEDTNSLIRKS